MAFVSRTDLEQRIKEKIKYEGDCWIWTGATVLGIPVLGCWFSEQKIQRNRPVRRMIVPGFLGSKVYVTCENPLCVKPEHLTIDRRKAAFWKQRYPAAQNEKDQE